ncbi:CpaD family pilus assembly lipoprotein [Phenylobacterium soli]|uniref:Uncharacterized protein n=1 Tax=Phenylobacterium soli TaxID=2170551 RepID=A0A328ACA2_9CAUL|nr:CpaD family pilus assembly lipoprotein [Phenylobacterium soli]RAK51826.1 hypothetical protein DJ017_18590 [Phenylobacterium soli]
MRADFRISITALSLLGGMAAAAAARAEPSRESPPVTATPASACTREPARGPWPMLPFGCATEANLRAMIADPADLQEGRPLAPGQGDAAFAAAHRHRTGTVKTLNAAGQGGAGGGAAGGGLTITPAGGQ